MRGKKSILQRLTATDQDVLRQIAKEGFQTYPELRVSVIQSTSRQHSWKLLKRLVTLGFLSECRGDGGGIRGWAISPQGQTQLRGLFKAEWRVDRRPPVYRTAFDHDVALREVKGILSSSPKISDWVPEHVLKADIMSRVKNLSARDRGTKLLAVPDGLFQFQSGSLRFKAALELDLTRKSKKRLFKKFEAHITSSDFDFVFFIVAGENLLRLLWSVYQDVIANSGRIKTKIQQNGIYFTTLENIRKDRLAAKYAGLKDVFSFNP